MRTMDGEYLKGVTNREIITDLRLRSFNFEPNNNTYMRRLSERLMNVYSVKIRCNNAANFVADLLKIGFLVKEEKYDADGKNDYKVVDEPRPAED